jgi:hypothetical protein
MAANPSPTETRTHDPVFVHDCSLAGLRDRLPLRWPTPPKVPPSPKQAYRSHYLYPAPNSSAGSADPTGGSGQAGQLPGWQELLDPAAWEHLSHFDLVLRLIDFSNLRPVLAQRLGWTSARGQVPFDPVSMFLLLGWQIDQRWSRTEVLKNLADPRYADYALRFGFESGLYPTEGGVRYYLTALGRHSDDSGDTVAVGIDEESATAVAIQYLNQLLVGAVVLMQEAGLFSPQVWNQALVCPDGMLQEAASRMRCASVQDSCYQPTSAQQPRPCPAKDKEREGCACDTLACVEACRYATPRDAEARYVHYSGSNQPGPNPNRSTDPAEAGKSQGRDCYGYRSLPLLLVDPVRRFHVTVLSDFLSANAREEVPASALLAQLALFYPDLHLDAVVGDAGFGYEVFLHTIYKLEARRVVDLRAHETDKDKTQWSVRGYDDHGRPMCTFGYAFTSNGFDAEHQRHKWFCGQACLHGKEPRVRLAGVTYPPPECGYQKVEHPYGKILNVAERFPDGSLRLVRDVPVGSTTWKEIYRRARNASEGRNATIQRADLKRLPVYGGLRGKAFSFLADTWSILKTAGRLVREATFANTS